MHSHTEEISFLAPDRFQIAGTVFLPETTNGYGVILLHQLGLDRSSMFALAEALQAGGCAVLALDVRGHGKSTERDGETVLYDTMSLSDFNKIPGMDVEEAMKILHDSYHIDLNHIGIVGASIGANSALMAAARDPQIAFSVALSPGLDFRGLQPEADISQIQKPVLFVVARDDEYSLNSVTLLSNMVSAPDKEVRVYEKAGHGVHMFETDAQIQEGVVKWILEHTR